MQLKIQKAKKWIEHKDHALLRAVQSQAILDADIQNQHVPVCWGTQKRLQQGQAILRGYDKASPEYAAWQHEWNLARNGERYAVGSKHKPCGNGEIQYNPIAGTYGFAWSSRVFSNV